MSDDNESPISPINWPTACMGCGTTDPNILTLTTDGITTIYSVTNPLASKTMRDIDGAIFSRPISDISVRPVSIADALTVSPEHQEPDELTFARIHLPIHMYMCPKCNPFNQTYTRFIEIAVPFDEKLNLLFYEFGYFRNEEYKRLFFELNAERVLAGVSFKKRE